MRERKHPRLKGYDYNQAGHYYLTICTKERECILSSVVGRGILDAPTVELTEWGRLAEGALSFLSGRSPDLQVEKYVIMPNHLHLIVRVAEGGPGASGKPRPTEALIPKFVSSLKRYTDRMAGRQLWQRSYYDHVLRGEGDYLRVWRYMDENPAKWQEDVFYPTE